MNQVYEFLNDKYIWKVVLFLVITLFMSNPVVYAQINFENIQSELIYYPEKDLQAPNPALRGKIQNVNFKSSDGLTLNGWYIPAQNNKPTVLLAHGNYGNISSSDNQERMAFLINNGYGVFTFDYRGYGQSQGTPSEQGLYTDIESAINYLVTVKNIPRSNIILWGHSLGGAVVANAATRNNYRGVILESTFTNTTDLKNYYASTINLQNRSRISRNLYNILVGIIPVTESYNTISKIGSIRLPVLIVHSVHDRTIPVSMANQLSRANPNAQLFISQTGSHNSSLWAQPRILEFLNSLNTRFSLLQDQVLNF